MCHFASLGVSFTFSLLEPDRKGVPIATEPVLVVWTKEESVFVQGLSEQAISTCVV